MRNVGIWFVAFIYIGAFLAIVFAGVRRSAEHIAPTGPAGPEERGLLLTIAPPMVILLLVAPLLVPQSLGVSPDSTQYLAAASNVAAGKGLLTHWWDPGDVPLTHFPPLLPLVLAGVSTFDAAGSMETAARTVNLIALAITLTGVFYLTRRATGNTLAGIAAVATVALARDVQQVHAMVFSEPLYMAIAMTSLVILVRSIDTPSAWLAGIAGLLAGGGTATRYAGIGLIGAGTLVYLARRRIRLAVSFACAAALPVLAVFVRNAMVGGDGVANRELVFHPPTLAQLGTAASTLYHWLVPLDDNALLVRGLVLAGAVAAVLFVLSIIRSRRLAPSQLTRWPALALLIYLASYAAFMIFSVTFADAQIDLGPRILAPIIPNVAILAVTLLHSAWQHPGHRVTAGILSATCAAALFASSREARHSLARISPNYNTTEWRSSALIAAVRDLPADAVVITNYPDAIRYVSGRSVAGIPRRSSATSGRPVVDYPARMRMLCATAAERPVILAYFTNGETFAFLPPTEELRRVLSTHAVRTVADGMLETVPPHCQAPR